jgi:hypothetical protein
MQSHAGYAFLKLCHPGTCAAREEDAPAGSHQVRHALLLSRQRRQLFQLLCIRRM